MAQCMALLLAGQVAETPADRGCRGRFIVCGEPYQFVAHFISEPEMIDFFDHRP